MTLTSILILIALVLAGVDLVQSNAKSLTSWAVVLIALALLLPFIR